ncbi:hypothetical protein OYT1_ch1162 [Ferriphaselus amnicola]|uniref:Outer membrane protein beta-barrel domain-containing protein n=1 Tax=Ferriphaselus amnicola TaxID=1188319 RepID=A0A2Z6GBG5_9PROT|nr:outer membrane beta-barrel protein [Ferriphaselus amnicola]BBE50722.1 hypothetical protein OYT1_ch1162 [Ferriphaselus amnicola]
MKKILVVAALSAAMLSMSATADPYLGAGVGAYKTDTNNTSYKLFGGLQASPNFAVEAAYNDFRSYRGASADSWSLAAIGIIPLDQGWSVFGKLGPSYNRTRNVGGSNRTDLLAGVGVGFNASKDLTIRLEYEDFGTLTNTAGAINHKATAWGLNVKYSL